jgi:hypothetical protein
MKSLSDAWHIYRGKTFARYSLDARARAEIERAFFAGAESVVDDMQDMNDAGLTLPFTFTRQLTNWASECAHHDQKTREGNETETETETPKP